MADFETHPIGTTERIKQLEADVAKLTAERDFNLFALANRNDMLNRAKASAAAGYEVAARKVERFCRELNGTPVSGWLIRCLTDEIRNLASPIRYAALNNLIGEADELRALRQEHAEWSQRQFGDVSAIGPAKHLAKEAMEVAAAPHDAIAHADCWMLLWDMQRRAHISDTDMISAIRRKLAINKARDWPAPQEGEAREHTKAAEVEAK